MLAQARLLPSLPPRTRKEAGTPAQLRLLEEPLGLARRGARGGGGDGGRGPARLPLLQRAALMRLVDGASGPARRGCCSC